MSETNTLHIQHITLHITLYIICYHILISHAEVHIIRFKINLGNLSCDVLAMQLFLQNVITKGKR